MSALAARRAAEAARQSEPVASTSTSASTSRAPTPKRSTPTSTPMSAPRPAPLTSSPAESSLTSRATPTPKRRKADKIHPERQPIVQAKATGDDERKVERTRASRTARFSPSIPVDEDDGAGSSGEDIDEIEAGQEVSDGPDHSRRWSGPSTPDRGWTVQRYPEATSAFAPNFGTNLHMVDEEVLAQYGVQEESGPGAVVSLSEEDTLVLAGIFTITPLQGTIRVFSTNLSPSHGGAPASHTFFAPTSHSLPVIFPTSSKGDARRRKADLAGLHLPSTFAKDSARSLFIIRAHLSGLSGLQGDIVPGFSNIWLDSRGQWGLQGVHPVIDAFATPVYSYDEPTSWSDALYALEPPSDPESDTYEEQAIAVSAPVVIVKGPKRSGKSTLARATLNRLLESYERVAWLESDLGQGEFGCGGVVALYIVEQPVFGPPFTHPRIPERAVYLGSSTPQSCPDEYVAAVRHMTDYYRYEVQFPSTFGETSERRTNAVPLVVNTQGWVKGLGEELLQAIESFVQPTHVYAFEATQAEEVTGAGGEGWTSSPPWQNTGLPMVDDWRLTSEQSSAITYTLEPAPVSPLQARYTPADMRVMSIVAYFHSILDPSNVDWDFTEPLLAMQPLQVALGDKLREVYLTGEGSDAVLEDDLPLALNGSVIALHERLDTVPHSGDIYKQGRPLPSSEEINFLGLALVRGVQVDGTTSPPMTRLQLLTPLPAYVLRRASVVVKNGAMEIPTTAMLDWRSRPSDDGVMGYKWEDVPYLAAPGGSEAVGGERRRFRRNIMRKGA